jgi:hypothetical protein
VRCPIVAGRIEVEAKNRFQSQCILGNKVLSVKLFLMIHTDCRAALRAVPERPTASARSSLIQASRMSLGIQLYSSVRPERRPGRCQRFAGSGRESNTLVESFPVPSFINLLASIFARAPLGRFLPEMGTIRTPVSPGR